MPRLTFAVPRRIIPPPVESVNYVHAGVNFSYGLTSFGYAQNFGRNNTAQLGNNSIVDVSTPVSLGGLVKTFCKIGGTNGFEDFGTGWAIDQYGRAWSWGTNNFRQLGDGTTVASRRTPVSVRGAVKTFCEISSNSRGTGLAIDKNGLVWGWGSNAQGEIGDNTVTSRLTPVSVQGALKTFCKITSGYAHSMGIQNNGRLWAWGRNAFGQLGNTTIVSEKTPISVLGTVRTFCVIAAGIEHSMAIDQYGRVFCWGQGLNGRLGIGDTLSRRTPTAIGGVPKTFCKIAGSNVNSLAIDKNGKVWGWGANGQGQLGDGTLNQTLTPVSVGGINKTFCSISSGANHTLAIDNYGKVWGWGLNTVGELSIPTTLTPVSVSGSSKTFSLVAAGGTHVVSSTHQGRLWSWGTNTNGQLGNASTIREYTPISVAGTIKTFCKISAGDSHSLAIDNNGRAWGWGLNTNGRVGDNSQTQRTTPVCVCGAIKTFCIISAGSAHSLAIDKNGKAWGWGVNTNGRLGDNSTLQRLTPVSVFGTKTFSLISAGGSHSLGIDFSGRAWGWGLNTNGRIGDNSTVSRVTPVCVCGAIKTFCNISAGSSHSLAIDLNGRIWGWGLNSSGQLGDNSITPRLTPVAIAGTLKTFCKISAGNNFSLGIDQYGRAWGWGINDAGQLGVNSIVSTRVPISILGNVKTFCHISAGSNFSIAVDKNGLVWGWGRYFQGQLGNNLNTSTPIFIGYL